MDSNKELVEYLNSLKILQRNSHDEDIPEDIWNKYFDGNGVTGGLNVDKHRWYETSIDVYKVNGGFIGVNSVTDCFSEQSSIDDMHHYLEFFEMKQIMKPSYEKL